MTTPLESADRSPRGGSRSAGPPVGDVSPRNPAAPGLGRPSPAI